mmetsp:Transcript_16030/g.29372  ORF Transcript_16030/g.29372 Transcript_16030/m.29372 type:complete len:135 (+) Transcript_16030:689-1093(+)
MLLGLLKGQEKMSKSNPNSAIFMDDTEDEVSKKIRQAYCESGVVKGNPIMDYCKHLVFGVDESFHIKSKGFDENYAKYADLEADFLSGKLHPSSLKPALASWLNMKLQPVRDHFNLEGHARQLSEEVKSFLITR